MNMRGQLSYTIKPFTLVLFVVVLLLLFSFLNKSDVEVEKMKKGSELVSTATDTLLLLANSEDCLAYQVRETSSSYANIVNVKTLDEFVEKYKDIEPECARSYDFGFRVKIVEIETNNSWSFGASNFSIRKAYRNKIEYWIPVAIRYSEKVVKPGKMVVTMVDGELEKIAGFLDFSCRLGMLGQSNTSTGVLYTSYPLIYVNGSLCLDTKPRVCRKLLCDLDFKGIDSPGEYRLITNFEYPNKLMVRT